jgi:DNA-binding XRE family transcriptional regulator
MAQVKKTAAQIKAEKEANPKGKREVPLRPHYVVPNKLKELRDTAGLSLGDVESGSGVGSQTVASAEAGGDVSLSRAMALACFWELSINEIWTGEIQEKAAEPKTAETAA